MSEIRSVSHFRCFSLERPGPLVPPISGILTVDASDQADYYVREPRPAPFGNLARLLALLTEPSAIGTWTASAAGMATAYSRRPNPTPPRSCDTWQWLRDLRRRHFRRVGRKLRARS